LITHILRFTNCSLRRERELQRQQGPSWTMRTHAEVLAEIDRIRESVALEQEVGAEDESPWIGARGRSSSQTSGRKIQKKMRGGDRGNDRNIGRGKSAAKGKGRGREK